MHGLYVRTYEHELVDTWIDNKITNLNLSIDQLPPFYTDDLLKQITKILSTLTNKLLKPISFKKIISTSLTHGDYAPGNIIYTDDPQHSSNVYLIDWDNVSRRFIMYDFLVYRLLARQSIDFSIRCKEFINNKINNRASCSSKIFRFYIFFLSKTKE